MPNRKQEHRRLSRREFIKRNTAAAAGISAGLMAPSSLASAGDAFAGRNDTLRVGLVGCGDRGAGAAAQAMKADPNVELTAMADVFEDRLDGSLELLREEVPDKINVVPERRFVGLDAYRKVVESDVDVVLLATPPAFRPKHLEAVVEAGKHVFAEKPLAVDGPGVRSVMESVRIAEEKGLAVGSGFCLRYDNVLRETVAQIHQGAVGDIISIQATRFGGTLDTKYTGEREPGWSDLEWQLRNWYNFCWFSGDHLVEQAVHNVDKVAWLLQDRTPVKAVATGGQQARTFGNIYDHFHIRYEYEDGLRTYLTCRQQDNCHNEQQDIVIGTEGRCEIGRDPVPKITGAVDWTFEGEERNNMYQVQHDELFASIRAGTPLNDGAFMAQSTLMAIMGRMAAYTGREVTWEEALNTDEQLLPARLDWNQTLGVPPVPIPGTT